MDEFEKDVLDCYNSLSPKRADSMEEMIAQLDRAFERGNVNKPLNFDED